MWSAPCAHEEAVRRMAREGRADAALQAHVAVCADCRDTLEIAEAMHVVANAPVGPSERPVPSASYLWWKAELLRRWDAEQRAMEPVDMGERLGAGIAIVGAVAVLWWIWQRTDLELPMFLSIENGGIAFIWLVATIVVFAAVILGLTAAAMLDAGDRNRKD